jgi:hypothetical protein
LFAAQVLQGDGTVASRFLKSVGENEEVQAIAGIVGLLSQSPDGLRSPRNRNPAADGYIGWRKDIPE